MNGNNLVIGDLAITWQTTGSAALHNIADANDGTYTVEIANDIVEDVTITASIAGTAVINTATVSFIPGEASLTTSTVTADPTTVIADGKTKSTITLQIKDVHDNDLTTSNLDITMVITTGDATLSNVTDNLDGTYTATITSTTTGDAIITAKIAGAVVTNTATVSFIPGEASLTTSTVTADPTTVIADGKTKSTITLQTKDAQSNNLVTGNLDVTMTATNFATLSAVTDNKDGTYTATITNTKAESVTITAKIAGAVVTNTATVSFIPGEVSLTTSTVTADPTTVIADGKTKSTITLQTKDAQSNNLVTGGLEVTMTATNSATLSAVTDNKDGTYTATITSTTTTGNAIITAKIAGEVVTNTATVSFIATIGDVSVATSTLVADPTTIVADGKTQSSITLQAKDADGENLTTTGLAVTMTASNSARLSSVTDNLDGTYATTITSNTTGDAVITASIAGAVVTNTATISFIATLGDVSVATSTLVADPTTIVADGKTQSSITLQAKDADGENLTTTGLAVTMTATNSAKLSSVTDNLDGTYAATITSTTTGDTVITASIAGAVVTNTATISFIATLGDVSVATSTLVADPTTVVADGKALSTITLQVKDVHGNNLATSNLDVTMTATNSATLGDITDNEDGTYTAEITSTTAGDAIITARIAGAVVTNTATVSFIPGEVSLTTSTLIATPKTVLSNGTSYSTITLQTKDAYGNNLVTGDLAVTMTATNSATLSAVTDNEDGTYTADITSTTAGDAIITAKIAGAVVTNTATVSFIASIGDVSVATSTLVAADPATIVADGKTQSSITLQAKDAYGENLTTTGLAVTMTATNFATLSSVTDNEDGTYTATITSSTTAGDAIITAKIAGAVVTNTATVSFIPGEASLTTSTVTADPTTVVADGESKSTITLQTIDTYGNNLVTGNLDVTMTATNSATLGDITDNKDGTYTAEITSNTTGDAIITAKIAGAVVTNTATITFYIPGDYNTHTSTLTASPMIVVADGESKSTITLYVKDIKNINLLDNIDQTIVMEATGSAILSSVTGNHDGTYTATITSNTAEEVTITAFVIMSTELGNRKLSFGNTATVSFIPGEASLTTSALTADPITIIADGKTKSTITLQAKDAKGNNLITGGLDVTMTASNSATLSSVTDNLDGTYAVYITSTNVGDAIITAHIAGEDLLNKAKITFFHRQETINFKGKIYKTIASPDTQRIWLDRNLGAEKVCEETSIESTCFGDLYQWGRKADGHQTRTSEWTLIPTYSIYDTEWNNNFNARVGGDWVITDDSGALRVAAWADGGRNDICPAGFSVPTLSEFQDNMVNITNRETAFRSFLKISIGGRRYVNPILERSMLLGVNANGYYWTRSPSTNNTALSMHMTFSYADVKPEAGERVNGMSIRCIKDQ